MSESEYERVSVCEHTSWGERTDYTEELEAYCDWLRSIGRKVRTITTYHSDIKRALQSLHDAGLSWRCEEIGPREIYFIKDHLGVKEQTTRVRIKRLDAMIQWKTGHSVVLNMSILWNRVIPTRHFITAEQFGKMYRVADPPTRMVLCLGGMMGLRRAEICAITLDDISDHTITVHGKGHGEDGLVTDERMPPEVIAELKSYKKWRSLHVSNPHDRRLIVMTSKKGHVSRRRRMDTRVSECVSECANRAGIVATTHSLRRLFGTTAYAVSGHDLSVTQRMLRHASPNTTIMCYIDADETAKNEALNGVGAMLASAI